jgi:hypothetical protein
LPLVIVTSEFGTVAMWDWEIVSFLKGEGLKTFVPYNLELTKAICKNLAVKRDLQETKFLAFQDNPGEGFQADIFTMSLTTMYLLHESLNVPTMISNIYPY